MKKLFYIFVFTMLVSASSAFAEAPPQYLMQWGVSGSGQGQFAGPLDIAVDNTGNVYVADTQNHRIQKFTSTGQFITMWGNYGSGSAEFKYPVGICADPSGNIYVADELNDRVQKFTTNGIFISSWQSSNDAIGLFGRPTAVASDLNGYIYVSDGTNHRVQKLTGDGIYVQTIAADAAPRLDGLGISSTGELYITDVSGTPGQSTILHYTTSGGYNNRYGCSGGYPTACAFSHPNAIAVDQVGNFYVVDNDWFRVVKYTATGVILSSWGTWGSGDGQFDQPYGIAVNRNSGWVYVCEEFNNRIQVFGDAPVPTTKSTWGRVKTLYR